MTEYQEYQCKFCWGTSLSQHLISPCSCTGTMKFVHPECLQSWLHQKGEEIPCEVCKSPIHFTLPLHHDISFVLLCVWAYLLFVIFVPYFYAYYTSVGGVSIKA
jgi:E3 ubiquitin-protein ligase DOA10